MFGIGGLGMGWEDAGLDLGGGNFLMKEDGGNGQ